MKKRVAIIGAGEFQNPLILKAKECGYETHVFAWKTGAIGEYNADYFYDISIRDKEKILEECKKIKPNAVCSIASDLAVITVNYVADALGLTGNNSKYSEICTNKYAMRTAFQEAGFIVPRFIRVDNNLDINIINDFEYPLIIKPTDRSGSRGVTKVYNKESVKEAIEKAISCSFEKRAIIEEYIDGDEYSCECISNKGKHHFLTVTKKYTSGEPHYIETAHMEPSGLKPNQLTLIKKEIFKALDALHIEYGPSHSEFKINNNGEIRIIEIGARMGGDCIGSDLVKLSTGYDFVELALKVALGQDITLARRKSDNKIAFIKFIFTQEDLEVYKRIKKETPEIIYSESIEEDLNHEITDSSTRYGFYIICCNNKMVLKEYNLI